MLVIIADAGLSGAFLNVTPSQAFFAFGSVV
jgi:hypothetical protein